MFFIPDKTSLRPRSLDRGHNGSIEVRSDHGQPDDGTPGFYLGADLSADLGADFNADLGAPGPANERPHRTALKNQLSLAPTPASRKKAAGEAALIGELGSALRGRAHWMDSARRP